MLASDNVAIDKLSTWWTSWPLTKKKLRIIYCVGAWLLYWYNLLIVNFSINDN